MREQKVPMTAAQRTLHRIKKDRVLYLILSPTIIYFCIFRVWPMINMRLAFFDFKARGPWEFAGLKYFELIFQSSAFMQILKNTLIISFMKYVLLFPVFVIFALVLNEPQIRADRILFAPLPVLGRNCWYLEVLPGSLGFGCFEPDLGVFRGRTGRPVDQQGRHPMDFDVV